MRSRCFIVLTFMLASAASAEEPATPPAPVPAENAPALMEQPKPIQRPKLMEKPKAAERPQASSPTSESVPQAASTTPVKPEVQSTVAPSSPAPSPPAASRGAYSLPCWVLAFAMLILGIAVGFLGRHLMSRHKLGGMTVRIGTWRGIP